MKNIAIAAGGDSSEYGVSLRSAEGIYKFLDKERYHPYLVIIKGNEWFVSMPDGNRYDIDRQDFSSAIRGEKIRFDFVYNTIHGRPGEDGRLQGYLDMIGMPYSSSGVSASALTFNKYFNNQYLKSLNIRVADSMRLIKGQAIEADNVIRQLGLPLFVKPNDGGSSYGVTKVKEASQLLPAIDNAFREGSEVIVESFVAGTEVSCGCYKTKVKQVVFPITEIVTQNEFFDYDAKYKGQVEEITPARIADEMAKMIQNRTLKIYDLVGAKGLIRIDYIIPADHHPVLLEINTNPGMTETSFIPQQIKSAGLDIKDVITEIIENEC